MLELEMLIGVGAVALWTYLRFPRLRPRSLFVAALHLVVSFLAFATLPATLGALLQIGPSPEQARFLALALLISTFTYLLLAWIWFLARILRDLPSGPRGGHPVATKH
jgi:hypothetical protein